MEELLDRTLVLLGPNVTLVEPVVLAVPLLVISRVLTEVAAVPLLPPEGPERTAAPRLVEPATSPPPGSSSLAPTVSAPTAKGPLPGALVVSASAWALDSPVPCTARTGRGLQRRGCCHRQHQQQEQHAAADAHRALGTWKVAASNGRARVRPRQPPQSIPGRCCLAHTLGTRDKGARDAVAVLTRAGGSGFACALHCRREAGGGGGVSVG